MENLSQKVISLLKEDARYSAKQIAIMLGESESVIKTEIERLENSGVIFKYTALINDEENLENKVEALIEVKVAPKKLLGFDAIAEELSCFSQVKSLYLMSGGFDLAVFIEGKSLKDIARFVSEKLSTMDAVLSTATHFILKKYKIEGVVAKSENDTQRLAVQP